MEIFLISLLLEALNEVSLGKFFLVFFFYIWLSKVDSIFIIIRTWFSSVNSILIGSFLSSSFSSKLLLLYFIKISATGLPVTNFLWNIFTLCVSTALLRQDQTILMWFPSSKLIYELFLIYWEIWMCYPREALQPLAESFKTLNN